MEREGGFPGSGGAGNDGELSNREVEIEVLQVVLASSTNSNDVW